MWSVLRDRCSPVLVDVKKNSAGPIMVSLAVLGALSRANGGGYVTFLNFCAYFSAGRSADTVRSLFSLADFFQNSRM